MWTLKGFYGWEEGELVENSICFGVDPITLASAIITSFQLWVSLLECFPQVYSKAQ